MPTTSNITNLYTTPSTPNGVLSRRDLLIIYLLVGFLVMLLVCLSLLLLMFYKHGKQMEQQARPRRLRRKVAHPSDRYLSAASESSPSVGDKCSESSCHTITSIQPVQSDLDEVKFVPDFGKLIIDDDNNNTNYTAVRQRMASAISESVSLSKISEISEDSVVYSNPISVLGEEDICEEVRTSDDDEQIYHYLQESDVIRGSIITVATIENPESTPGDGVNLENTDIEVTSLDKCVSQEENTDNNVPPQPVSVVQSTASGNKQNY